MAHVAWFAEAKKTKNLRLRGEEYAKTHNRVSELDHVVCVPSDARLREETREGYVRSLDESSYSAEVEGTRCCPKGRQGASKV